MDSCPSSRPRRPHVPARKVLRGQAAPATVQGTVGGAANIDLSVNPSLDRLGIKQGGRPCPASTPRVEERPTYLSGWRKGHLNSIQRLSSSLLLPQFLPRSCYSTPQSDICRRHLVYHDIFAPSGCSDTKFTSKKGPLPHTLSTLPGTLNPVASQTILSSRDNSADRRRPSPRNETRRLALRSLPRPHQRSTSIAVESFPGLYHHHTGEKRNTTKHLGTRYVVFCLFLSVESPLLLWVAEMPQLFLPHAAAAAALRAYLHSASPGTFSAGLAAIASGLDAPIGTGRLVSAQPTAPAGCRFPAPPPRSRLGCREPFPGSVNSNH